MNEIYKNKNKPKKIKRNKQKNKKNSFFQYLLIIIIASSLAGFLGINIYLASLKPIKNLDNNFKPNIGTKIYSADNELLKTFSGYKSQKVSIDKIPANLKNAIIATEDKNFYKHTGYDPIGLARSVVANLMAGKVVQGASTITQQLARILFLNNDKTFDRKIKEFKIAASIEKTLTKDEILEMYLNNVYLGSGAYGVAAAAQTYFNKSLNELTLAEAALIAGLPQAPSVYSPFNKPKLAIQRRNQVLKRMLKTNYISKTEYKKALNEQLKLNPNQSTNSFNRAGYFIDYVIDELETLGFTEQEISQGDYKIITTLNYKAQKAAENAIASNLAAWGLKQAKQQAAAFAFSPVDGKILAYVGGKSYSQSQYDRVRFAVRPPGSAFKPFVYAAAIEKGYNPNLIMLDMPIQVNDWAPKNYGNKYRGEIPLFYGLTISSNVVAVKLLTEIGIRPVITLARTLGISTPIQNDYTIALGSNGVKLYEMTIAYGAFANDGFKVRPYSVEQVETSRGKVIYKAPIKHSLKVLDNNTAAIMTAMLKTVVESGTGRGANINRPAAAKTGTTDNYKDAWFMGYTPEVVTGVWVGNDDNSDMGTSLTGGTIPAKIWKAMMIILTEPYGKSDFDYPEIPLNKNLKPKTVLTTGDEANSSDDDTAIDSNTNHIQMQEKTTSPEDAFTPLLPIKPQQANYNESPINTDITLPPPIPAKPLENQI